MVENVHINMPDYSEAQSSSIVKIRINTCVCCLAENVPFVKLSNCKHVEFFDFNFRFKLQYEQALVCYVCHGMLKDIFQFKRQVVNSVAKLNTKVPHFKPNNMRLSKLKATDIEVFFMLDLKLIEHEVNNIEPKIGIKIESDCDPENVDPLSQIKQNESVEASVKVEQVSEKVQIEYNSPALDEYEHKIKCALLSASEMREERSDAVEEVSEEVLSENRSSLDKNKDKINCVVQSVSEMRAEKKGDADAKVSKKLKITNSAPSLNKYGGKIKCFLLSESEMQEERKRDAEQEKFKKLLYRCESCIVGFDHEPTLKEHMEKIHAQVEGGFTCSICASVITTQRTFNMHMRRHYRRFECAACGARYTAAETALAHYHRKHDAILTEYKCDQCEFTTPLVRRLKRHKLSHKPREVNCGVCGNTFASKSSLKGHMYRVHKVSDRVFTCDECPKTYRGRTGLFAHKKTAHRESGVFCEPCRKHFPSADHLKSHLKTARAHTDNNKYACTSCDARFGTKYQLTAHVDWVHLNIQHKCGQCDKTFKTTEGLKSHTDIIHNKKVRPKDKICDFCGRGFTTLAILRAHVHTHTGERPHRCTRCAATFAHPAALYTHNRLLHEKDKTSRDNPNSPSPKT